MQTEIDLLKEAAEEISSLRNRNELMNARLDMFDKCMLLLHTSPNYQSQGMGEDLLYKINKHIQSVK